MIEGERAVGRRVVSSWLFRVRSWERVLSSVAGGFGGMLSWGRRIFFIFNS